MGWELLRGQLGSLAAQGGGSVIQSIQSGSITIASSSLSNTATISSVDTSKSIIIYDGLTTDNAAQNQIERWATRIALTNGTTVTATRENNNESVTVRFTVIEFASSGVNSIQAGTIAIGVGATSNTATISAVGANAFVLWLGSSSAVAGLTYGAGQGSVVLTNSTTVTASCLLGQTFTVGYMVVDLGASIVDSVQAQATTDTSTNTSWTGTITSLSTSRSLLFYNGMVGAIGLTTGSGAITDAISAATTVTMTRGSTNAASRTSYYTVVQFNAAVVNSVQRGTITQSAATSNTATISSVTTAKSFVNFGSWRGATANHNTLQATLTLTNATTVTSNTNSAGSPTVAYEVMEFK